METQNRLMTLSEANNSLRNLWCVFLTIMPFLCLAQANITGKVIDKVDGQPIPGATVFLNNATTGTSTNKDGFFTLPNVQKGQYDLVVSCLSYATYYQKVIAGDSPVTVPVVELTVKATDLHEVKINANRDEYLKMFIAELLGRSANAPRCKILNPDVINVSYSAKANTLTASTDDYLTIENNATGYRVYYQVDKFSKDYNTKLLHYEGPVRFEELKGKGSDQKKWAKNREAIYKGSSMHFLRAVFQANFTQEGFKVFKLIRRPNPNRPPDSLLRAKVRAYSVNTQAHPGWRDSVNFYMGKMRLPKISEVLVTTPLAEKDIAQPAENSQLMQLQFKDNLYIIYAAKAKQDLNIINLQNSFSQSGTVVSLNNKRALFDSNGIFIDPSDTIVDGAWGLSGVADMLPINYMP